MLWRFTEKPTKCKISDNRPLVPLRCQSESEKRLLVPLKAKSQSDKRINKSQADLIVETSSERNNIN